MRLCARASTLASLSPPTAELVVSPAVRPAGEASASRAAAAADRGAAQGAAQGAVPSFREFKDTISSVKFSSKLLDTFDELGREFILAHGKVEFV